MQTNSVIRYLDQVDFSIYDPVIDLLLQKVCLTTRTGKVVNFYFFSFFENLSVVSLGKFISSLLFLCSKEEVLFLLSRSKIFQPLLFS